MAAKFKWVLQLHRDVPKAAQFYSQGLDLTLNVCTLRWAELESGPLKLALMHSTSDQVTQKGYSSLLSFTVPGINHSATKLIALGAELDGPMKYEIHGRVITDLLDSGGCFEMLGRSLDRPSRACLGAPNIYILLVPCN
ncbi:hypothetical protein MLD38_039069 [Melastoma candidum]|uniref:Uncharacterized protein n=1 Tax=Melastoma candidum TaxID=119954 RepID=A0ACB9L1L9_9MYRT|nr:hypothetical protein MLD38_039069 [Melastoma candidum]